jgi:hypothetical protein
MSELTSEKRINSNTFPEYVRNWVIADNQLKLINEKTKKLRDYRTQLNTEIVQYMQEKNIAHSTIEISDGELSIYQKREYTPLTFGYIESCLAAIIADETHVEYIMQYLKDQREIKFHNEIKRTQKNRNNI